MGKNYFERQLEWVRGKAPSYFRVIQRSEDGLYYTKDGCDAHFIPERFSAGYEADAGDTLKKFFTLAIGEPTYKFAQRKDGFDAKGKQVTMFTNIEGHQTICDKSRLSKFPKRAMYYICNNPYRPVMVLLPENNTPCALVLPIRMDVNDFMTTKPTKV